MSQSSGFSAVHLQDTLRDVRRRSRAFMTNFFVPPAEWPVWIERGLIPILITDEVLLMVCPEEACHRLYFAGDRERLSPALSQCVFSTPPAIAVDLVGRPGQVASLAEAFSAAGFDPHVRLVRLSATALSEQLGSPPPDPGCEAAKATDVPQIIELLQQNFDRYADQIPSPRAVHGALDRGEIQVVREGARLYGFLWFTRTGATGFIRYWCVAAEARGRGVGSRLMSDYSLRTESCARHLLWVRENNPTATACYHHYGYRPDGLEDLVMVLGS